MARRGLWIGLFGSIAAGPLAADWALWLSPSGDTDELDQFQLAHEQDQSAVVTAKAAVGQTFVPTRRSLYRIDFKIDNADDTRPGRIRLYRWRGSHGSTISSRPLFEDVVDLSGSPGYLTQSFFPRIEVRPGKFYYLEFSATGRRHYRVAQAIDAEDPYPGGRAFRNGRVSSKGGYHDLWFRTWGRDSVVADDFEEGRPADAVEVPVAGGGRREARTSSDPRARWFPPRSWHKPITRRNYYERVENFADRYRSHALAACREILHGDAMREAFLYRVSCEEGACNERHVVDALAIFRIGHAWQFCSGSKAPGARSCATECVPDAPMGFDRMDRPARAYAWIRDSPTLEENDHEMIRELLLDRARRYWPGRETGAHNRAMTAAVGYRLVSDLFPDVPEASDWRAYARNNWNAFWAYRDTYEDSAMYSGVVWWPSVLAYAEIAGLEERIWSDERFLKLVDRFAAETIPLGVLPNFGDSVGWPPDPSGLVWLFEAAAAHTQRPEYRWIAHRLFEYATQRVRDDWPRRDAFYLAHPSMMGAYFATDDTLDPRRPFDRREEVLLSRKAEDPMEARLSPGQSIGAVFEATATPLARISVGVRNMADERPARVSLWRWRGSRERTVRDRPIYRDALGLQGEDRLEARSVHPFLDLEVGSSYYLAIDREEAPLVLETDRTRKEDFSFELFTLTGQSSIVTDRVRARRRSRDAQRAPRQHYEFTEERAPDKLVLRSGNAPEDLHAVFNLVAGHQHGQSETGAMISLVDAASVLVTSGPFPYWYFGNVRAPQDESLPFLRRHWGGRHGRPGNGAIVTRFSDSRAVTVAEIRFRDPNGWQVEQRRTLFFVKNRFLLVRDRFVFPHDITVSAGPVWHARDLSPERGRDFFDIYDRQPLSDVWRVRNPERHALVYFVPRTGRVAEAGEISAYLPPASCPLNSAATVKTECRGGPTFFAAQRWSGSVKGGESRFFDTLIVPHSPRTSPKVLADGIRVLVAKDALAVELDLGRERWLVVDDPTGRGIDEEAIATDARYLVARTAPNEAPYWLTHEATRVRWHDRERSWPVSTSVEVGAELPQKRIEAR
jgi:hypothetical protein